MSAKSASLQAQDNCWLETSVHFDREGRSGFLAIAVAPLMNAAKAAFFFHNYFKTWEIGILPSFDEKHSEASGWPRWEQDFLDCPLTQLNTVMTFCKACFRTDYLTSHRFRTQVLVFVICETNRNKHQYQLLQWKLGVLKISSPYESVFKSWSILDWSWGFFFKCVD